jgi:hypothetical protein
MSRTVRWPLLIAWVVILGLVAYILTHPRAVAPLVSRLVSRNLLRDVEGTFRFRDFRWRPLRGADLYDVSVTFKGKTGGLTLLAIDSLSLTYRLGELLAKPAHLRTVDARGCEGYVILGAPSADQSAPPVAWPRLRVDRLDLHGGALEISDSDGRLKQRLSSLAFRGAVRSDSLLEFDVLAAEVLWETHASHLRDMQGAIDVGPRDISFRDLRLWLDDSRVRLDGQRAWDGALALDVQADSLRASDVEDLLDLELGFAAQGHLAAAIESRADSLFFAGTFSGELEGYRLEDVFGRAVITPGLMQWDELRGEINSTHFVGDAQFDLSEPGAVTFLLSGDVDHVDLSRGLVPDTELPASDGHGRLRIYHSDAPLTTRVDGVLLDGFIAAVPFDSLEVEVLADAFGVNFDRIRLRYRALEAVLSGRSDPALSFKGVLDLAVADLAELPGAWKLPTLTGSLSGRGDLQGTQDHLSYSSQLALRDFTLAPVGADSSSISLRVENLLSDPQAVFGWQGGGLQIGQVPLGEFLVRGNVSARAVEVEFFRASLGDTVVAMRGRADFDAERIEALVTDLQMDWEGNHWQLAGPVTFSVGGEGVFLPECRFASEQGNLLVAADYRRGQSVAGVLELGRFDLGLLNPFLGSSHRLSGFATAKARISGHPDRPEVTVQASVRACEIGAARIDSLDLDASYQGGRIGLERLALAGPHGRLACRGAISHPEASLSEFWRNAALQLELAVTDGDWVLVEPLRIPALDRLAGRFSTNLQIGGTTAAPVVAGEFVSEPFGIHWLHLERLRGDIRLDRDRLILADLEASQRQLRASGRIEIPVTFDLLSIPTTPLDGPFLLRIELPPRSDLSGLVPGTNAFIDAGGFGEGVVTVAGPLEHPLYEGSIKIRQAHFVLKGLGEIYREVDIDGAWSGDILNLERIEGREGARGEFSGRGRLLFHGLELETFAIDLRTDRFLVASIPDLRVLVRSPRVHLSGVKVGPDSLIVPKFSGRLEVIRGRYTGDFAEKPGVSDPRAATVAPDWLADLQLVAPPRSFRIINRAMELSMSGDVDLIRDEEGLYLRGAMDIDSGRLPVFNNDFKVLHGALDFSQEVGLDPRIDLEAETQVRIRDPEFGSSDLERITAHVTGSLYEPQVEFASESGYPRQGIERMLLGMSPQAGDPRTAGGLRGASIAAGFTLLEREIAAGLNVIDTFDIDQVETRQADGSTGYSPLVGVGKYLGQDFYIKVAQGLSQADRDLLIEYQISNHLLLQSEIRRRIDELQGNLTYSLDLKYRFEY